MSMNKGVMVAMETVRHEVIVPILEGQSVGLVALFFFEDGYVRWPSNSQNAMILCRAFIEAEQPTAYGLVFEARYEEPLEDAEEALFSVVVTDEGYAQVIHNPITRDEKGDRELAAERKLLTDEEYVRLYTPLEHEKFDMERVRELVEQMRQIKREPYRDFVVGHAGLNNHQSELVHRYQ